MAVCLVLQQADTFLFWLLKDLSQQRGLFTLPVKYIFYQGSRHSSLLNILLTYLLSLFLGYFPLTSKPFGLKLLHDVVSQI